jgi:RNA polymerase sigma-70 factor (ECF subfamily)
MRAARGEGPTPLMQLRKAAAGISVTTQDRYSLQNFERDFETHWSSIYGLLRRMVGDPAEAEDLALETFYRLHQRYTRVPQDFNLGGWLYRVATNLGLQSIRGRKRRERYELAAGQDALEEAPEDRPAEIHAGEEERRLARRALAEMNPRRSQLLILRYSGLPYKEIAEALDLSAASIGPLLVRAEREFEKCYRALAQEDI